MLLAITMAATAAVLLADADADLIARVENTELFYNRRPASRIERDPEGNVVALRLDGMRLSRAEFLAVGRLGHLRALSLRRTNVSNADVRSLRTLARLQSLVLSSTNVNDLAVPEFVQFESLRSLCLGDSIMTPEGVEEVKRQFQAAKRRFAVGYSPRKPSPPLL